MLLKVLSRKPYETYPGMIANDKMSRAKADLGVYDFEDWKARQ